MKTRKIVVNRCFGGFGLSLKALSRYAELKGFQIFVYAREGNYLVGKCRRMSPEEYMNDMALRYVVKTDFGPVANVQDLAAAGGAEWLHDSSIERDDPTLVQVVEELGEAANGAFADLQIVEIPEDVDWEIDDYDGKERVAERHRSW